MKYTFRKVAGGLAAGVGLLLSLGQGCPPAGGNNPPPPETDKGLAAEPARIAFASQCALNVITCTRFFPKPSIDVVAGPNQSVTRTPTGFLVIGYDNDDAEDVHLVGSHSGWGEEATQVWYTWSHAAADDDPTTMSDGPVFSTEPDPIQRMANGMHHIRLRMQNDNIRDILTPQQTIFASGVQLYDFVEVQIEVRD
jgi:hypothetical protein